MAPVLSLGGKDGTEARGLLRGVFGALWRWRSPTHAATPPETHVLVYDGD